MAEVSDGGLVSSAVLSPLSQNAALLTVLQPAVGQDERLLVTTAVSTAAAETSAELPDVVRSVLGVVYGLMEDDGDDGSGKEQPHLSSLCFWVELAWTLQRS